MRRKVQATSETSAIKIYINPSSSGSIQAKDVHNRGIACAATIIALSRVRPIELVIWDIWGREKKGAVLIDLPTKPLDIGTILFAVSHPNFARSFYYPLVRDKLKYVDHIPTEARNELAARQALGLAGNDIILPILYGEDEFKEPIKWVRKTLEKSLKINIEEDLW